MVHALAWCALVDYVCIQA